MILNQEHLSQLNVEFENEHSFQPNGDEEIEDEEVQHFTNITENSKSNDYYHKLMKSRCKMLNQQDQIPMLFGIKMKA